MKVTGNLLKMGSQLADPVEYTLVIGGDYIRANDLIGKKVKLEYRNMINCIASLLQHPASDRYMHYAA